jgi:hypothetical protein
LFHASQESVDHLQSEEKNSNPFAQGVNTAQTKRISAVQNEFVLVKGTSLQERNAGTKGNYQAHLIKVIVKFRLIDR